MENQQENYVPNTIRPNKSNNLKTQASVLKPADIQKHTK